MNAHSHIGFGNRLPTPDEVTSAADAMTAIETGRASDRTLEIGGVKLSAPLVDLVSDLFSIIARGETVTLVPLSRRLTTQEAADILNVSRPHLIKLIERRELDCKMVGTHRRLALVDVLAYKVKRSEGRRDALKEMQDIAEDFGAS